MTKQIGFSGKRRGRPPTQIDPAALERLVRDGKTIKAAAAALGVGQRTLHAHLAGRPELRAAVDAGRRRGVSIDRPPTKIDNACEAGHWPAVRLRLLRNVPYWQSWPERFEARRLAAAAALQRAAEQPTGAGATRLKGRLPASIQAAELEALVAHGATLKQAAPALGVSIRTLHAHLARRPDLEAAVAAGKRRTASFQIAEAQLERLCSFGDWQANRTRILRDMGWFRAGLGRVPTRLMDLRQTFERL